MSISRMKNTGRLTLLSPVHHPHGHTTDRPRQQTRHRPFSFVIKRHFYLQAQAEDEEEAFEERLADLKRAKGETPYGEGKKKQKSVTSSENQYTNETVFYEGSPHSGDLAINTLLGVTIVWLPLTFAAIGRKFFIQYKFTDKRISVTTTAPWESNQTDVAYDQVKSVVAVGRGVGIWGDMVVTLKNGDRLEIRSLDRWQEIKNYVLERKAAAESPTNDSQEQKSTSGFSA